MSSTDQPITCLIADDHEIVREGLRMALSREPNIRVVGEASDGEAAVVLAERRRPAVVLMDVRMGNVDGVTAASRIRDRVPGTAVVLFTAHAERNLLQRGREAGARGYVLKEAGHDTIVRAIDRVARGEDFIDPALAPSLLELSRESLITGRERETCSCWPMDVQRGRRPEALHQPGDGQESRAPHPREARGRQPHAGRRDRPARIDHRVVTSLHGRIERT